VGARARHAFRHARVVCTGGAEDKVRRDRWRSDALVGVPFARFPAGSLASEMSASEAEVGRRRGTNAAVGLGWVGKGMPVCRCVSLWRVVE
jgi:hypothetical protein